MQIPEISLWMLLKSLGIITPHVFFPKPPFEDLCVRLHQAPDSREVQRSPVTTGAGGSPMAGSRQDMATAPVTTGLMSSAFKPSAPAPARMVNLSELTSSPSHSAGSLRSPPARNLRARRGRPAQHSAEAAAASVGGGSAMSEETTGSEPTAEESVPTAAGGRRNARRGKRKPDPRLDDISDIEEYRYTFEYSNGLFVLCCCAWT